MKTIVNGRNIELTPAIKAHVQEKIGKLKEHYDFVQEVHVFLGVEKNPSIKESHLAEATVTVPGGIVRVSVASTDLYGSIDELVKKADRGLRKHKTRLMDWHQGVHSSSIRTAEYVQALDGTGDGTDSTDEDDDDDTVWFDVEQEDRQSVLAT